MDFLQELRFVFSLFLSLCAFSFFKHKIWFSQGLRAFLPKGELMNRVNNFTGLKENVSVFLAILICSYN